MSILAYMLVVFHRVLTCFIDSVLFLNHFLVKSSPTPPPARSTESAPCQNHQHHSPVGKYRFTECLNEVN